MIRYKEFVQQVSAQIRDHLPAEFQNWTVKTEVLYKVNEKLDCLMLIPPGQYQFTAVPRFYLQDCYQMVCRGTTVEQVLCILADRIRTAPSPHEVEKSGFDILQFRDDVVLQVINQQRNTEFLKGVPHRSFLDLAAIYRIIRFDREGRWAGAIVNHSLMEKMECTEEELYQKARAHTPHALPWKMADLMELFSVQENGSHSGGPNGDTVQNRMVMLTNDSGQFGASALLYPEILDRACEKTGDRIYILPGSMHELYLVPEEKDRLAFYKHLVKSANEDVVDIPDWLSDHVYRYDTLQKKVSIAL